MIDWERTDLWLFTAEHQDATVEAWGGYVGKNDGFEPYGWTINYENKIYFFNLQGSLIKINAE